MKKKKKNNPDNCLQSQIFMKDYFDVKKKPKLFHLNVPYNM